MKNRVTEESIPRMLRAGLLATTVPGPSQRRVALAMGLITLTVFLALLPRSNQMLPAVPGFIPVYESAVVVNDLVTAVLLFGQFRILRAGAMLWLASAYVGTALLAAAHCLTFPGLFTPTGLLGATDQSTAWLYMFWHGSFPLCVIAYARPRSAALLVSPSRAAGLALVAVVATVSGLTWLATQGTAMLPVIMSGNGHTTVYSWVAGTTWLISVAAFLTQWRWRRRSTLDLWLLVVLWVWVFDIALSAFLQAARFDLGFYSGRLFGWVASFVVLSILLLENGNLYAKLLDTVDEERRAKAELQARGEELVEARSLAEQANRAKSAFLATISHEIRTPMNGVVGLIDVLHHTRLNDHQRDLMRTIRESAATLLTLIDDILDFSKIEAVRLEIESAPVALVDLIEGLCHSLLPVATRRGVDLSLFISPEVPTHILSDDVRLRQVIYNLLGNAIKFSAGRPDIRGRVSLRVDLDQTAVTPLLLFRISDNGIGIAPDILPTLFQPFTQAEASTTRWYGGTGLGLAISKRLVALMHGDIHVESEPGKGSVFEVRLPVQSADPSTIPPQPDVSGLHCVVVTSPDLAGADVVTYLEQAGAQVVAVGGMAEATALASGWDLAVIIQGMASNGQQASSRVHDESSRPGLRHVWITKGYAHNIQVRGHNVVTLNGDILRRQALLHAVAIAAGRASPIALPRREHEPPLKSPRAPSITEARQRGQLILVAEDDATNQKVVLQQLALLGYAAEVAPQGQQALEMWRRGGYALLLSDLHMPGMDGYTLAERIRDEEKGLTHLPILALTANALRSEARRVRATGFDDYLTKPVQLKVLRGALEKWMPTARDVPSTPAPAIDLDEHLNVDLRVLHSLVGNDPVVVADLLQDYLQALQVSRDELSQAVSQSDAETVEIIAHRLKSSSRSVGALALGELCAGLENAGKADDLIAIRQLLYGFLDTARLVEQVVCAHLETLRAS